MPESSAKPCLSCGYPLNGLTGPCPECGLDDGAAKDVAFRRGKAIKRNCLLLGFTLILLESLATPLFWNPIRRGQRAEGILILLWFGVFCAAAYGASLSILWSERVHLRWPPFWSRFWPPLLSLPVSALTIAIANSVVESSILLVFVGPIVAAITMRLIAPGHAASSL
ncbi:MAG: hypothetical protein GC200_11860 [Tepidisphaera sp.]|nr:hypothetical protein [Tepidisphaera sp.]